MRMNTPNTFLTYSWFFFKLGINIIYKTLFHSVKVSIVLVLCFFFFTNLFIDLYRMTRFSIALFKKHIICEYWNKKNIVTQILTILTTITYEGLLTGTFSGWYTCSAVLAVGGTNCWNRTFSCKLFSYTFLYDSEKYGLITKNRS